MTNRKDYWESMFDHLGESDVSWFQHDVQPSRGLIKKYIGVKDGITDIGACASRLVDLLGADGFSDMALDDTFFAALNMTRCAR